MKTDCTKALVGVDRVLSMSMMPKEATGAYWKARTQAPGLIQQESPPLCFLMSKHNDESAAASLIARHWEMREELFGDRFLAPLLSLDGTGAMRSKDIKIHKTGFITLLPNDEHDRPVLLIDYTRLPTDPTLTIRSQLRVTFYLLVVATASSNLRKDGFHEEWDVIIRFNLDTQVDLSFVRQVFDMASRAHPLRFADTHVVFCPHVETRRAFDSSLVSMTLKDFGEHKNSLTGVHVCFSENEIAEKLHAHGFARNILPPSLGGMWDRTAPPAEANKKNKRQRKAAKALTSPVKSQGLYLQHGDLTHDGLDDRSCEEAAELLASLSKSFDSPNRVGDIDYLDGLESKANDNKRRGQKPGSKSKRAKAVPLEATSSSPIKSIFPSKASSLKSEDVRGPRGLELDKTEFDPAQAVQAARTADVRDVAQLQASTDKLASASNNTQQQPSPVALSHEGERSGGQPGISSVVDALLRGGPNGSALLHEAEKILGDAQTERTSDSPMDALGLLSNYLPGRSGLEQTVLDLAQQQLLQQPPGLRTNAVLPAGLPQELLAMLQQMQPQRQQHSASTVLPFSPMDIMNMAAPAPQNTVGEQNRFLHLVSGLGQPQAQQTSLPWQPDSTLSIETQLTQLLGQERQRLDGLMQARSDASQERLLCMLLQGSQPAAPQGQLQTNSNEVQQLLALLVPSQTVTSAPAQSSLSGQQQIELLHQLAGKPAGQQNDLQLLQQLFQIAQPPRPQSQPNPPAPGSVLSDQTFLLNLLGALQPNGRL